VIRIHSVTKFAIRCFIYLLLLFSSSVAVSQEDESWKREIWQQIFSDSMREDYGEMGRKFALLQDQDPRFTLLCDDLTLLEEEDFASCLVLLDDYFEQIAFFDPSSEPCCEECLAYRLISNDGHSQEEIDSCKRWCEYIYNSAMAGSILFAPFTQIMVPALYLVKKRCRSACRKGKPLSEALRPFSEYFNYGKE